MKGIVHQVWLKALLSWATVRFALEPRCQPIPATAPPLPVLQVRLVGVTNGMELAAHAIRTLQADVVDLDGLITEVAFYADTNLVSRQIAPPFTSQLDAGTLTPGGHMLKALAKDNRGNQATSAAIEVKVLVSAPVVRAVYLVPLDRTFNPAYSNAVYRALTNLQTWYFGQLTNGTTFRLHTPAVESYITPHSNLWYTTNSGGYFSNALNDGFNLTGGSYPDPDFTWVFYLDADAKGQATGGVKGVAVLHQGDLQGLVTEAASATKRWIGGSGHELGHAFGLLHPPGCETPEPGVTCPTMALMWLGYTTYPKTFLLPADKELLNQSGFFYMPRHAPVLAHTQYSSGQFTFTASLESGWPFHLMTSSDLKGWESTSGALGQPSPTPFALPVGSSNAFFQVAYP